MSSSNHHLATGMNVEFYPTFSVLAAEPTLACHEAPTRIVEKQLRRTRSGFVFAPDFAAEHGLDEHLLASSRFIERQDWSTGRDSSINEVFFGELELQVDGEDEVTSVPVAAKPYAASVRDTAVHEYAGMTHFQRHPSLHPFRPIGFWVGEVGQPVVLTHFEEDVTTLDNLQWAEPDEVVSQVQPFTAQEALTMSARTLAALHLEGFWHGDAQIKNMAVDTSTTMSRLVDLTSLVQVDAVDDTWVQDWQHAVHDDLKLLISTVRSRGYLADADSASAKETIRATVINPHASFVQHPAHAHRVAPESRAALPAIADDILGSV